MVDTMKAILFMDAVKYMKAIDYRATNREEPLPALNVMPDGFSIHLP